MAEGAIAKAEKEGLKVWRFVRRAAGVILVQAALLALLAWIIPGFRFEDPRALIPAAVSMTLAQALLWPVIYLVAARFGPWLFPFVSFVLTGAVITIAARIDDEFGLGGVEVADLWTGVLIALGLTVGNTLLAAIFSQDDERAYDHFVTEPLRRQFRDASRSAEPGFIFLEIDGLSQPVLRQAIARGSMPTLGRWLASGSHTLTGWDPDFSSQTSASQAGILLGSNEGIPAFRWWDKPRQTMMVSSKMDTTHVLEAELSTGNGLLSRGGAGRWNAFSGDAVENIGVYSVFGDASKGSANTLLGYLLSPFMLARVLTLYVVDVVREWWEAWQQRRRNVLPRVHRGLKYSFIRAGTTAMQEASRAILTADILRGIPAVYNTFFGYDEVAHHSGIDREDSFKVLATIDKVIAHLERVAKDAPRPYHLIVLSDHGQSQGATFSQRYGMTLADLTDQLIAAGGDLARMRAFLRNDEAMGHVNVALSEAVRGSTRTAAMLRRALKRRMSGDMVELKNSYNGQTGATSTGDEEVDVVVLASGNLGIISFPKWQERMTLEQLETAFPRLVPGLVAHPGISFALVDSAARGPLAIGKDGVHVLTDDTVEGVDPLAPFGPHAAKHLLRESAFANVPDILVISMYDQATGEVAAFEELVGNHGGLGGPQREPFVLHPSHFDLGPEPIVGAGHLHTVLKGWIETAQGDGVGSRKSEVGSRET